MGFRNNSSSQHHPKSTASMILIFILFFTNTCVAQMEIKWLHGPWGECQHTRCGLGGKKYREIWCMDIQTGHRVLDSSCEPDLRPDGVSECNKPCTGNIILEPGTYQKETFYESHSPEYYDSGQDWRPFQGETRGHSNPEIRTAKTVQEFPVTSATANDVEWVIDQWRSCKLIPGAKHCGRNSGMQYRNVTCERKDRQGKVSSSRCQTDEPMPVTSQSCELLCKQNCVVSAYSEWPGCDSTCQLSNQTRTRHVTVPPRHRGSHCPDLSEMYVCDNCTHSYTYRFSDWLPCTSFAGSYLSGIRAHYQIGYQTREITCLQNKGVLTSLRLCSERLPHAIMHKYRACVMPQDCQVSSWSAMRPYNTSCTGYDGQTNHGYMIRTRQVLQLPLGDGQSCPTKLIDYIRLNKEDPSQLKPCKRAKWIMSSWSQCQSVPGYSHCGIGIQSRRAICVEAGDDGTERPVDYMRCPQSKPLVAQSCTLECSWDCSVSQWTAWSVCQNLDCDRPNLRRRRADGNTGERFRTREILTLPGPGGYDCPHLSETRMCEPELCYTWNVTYSPCEATTRGGCGDGTQLKKALCLNREGVKVRERFCHESLHSEQNWANCYVPCPEDCILSDWSQWSMCPDPCIVQAGIKSVRSRQRQILAYHGPGRNSRPCPNASDLRQIEPCLILYDCSTYQWETSIWGQCRLNIESPNIHCGPGTQTRTVECYNSKGVATVDNKCTDKVKPKVIQSCVVECPIDCHVTEWSEWTECGVKCLPVQARQIYPTQVRRRFILQYPQNGGLSCPIDFKEEQSCFGLPVCQTYFWKVTDWSDCILPPVIPLCGQGLKARNITCYHADNQSTRQISVVTCLEKIGSLPDLTEACYIPCESKCQFSSWSQWTMCGPRCEKTRFRFRRLMDGSKNNTECRNTELHPRDEHKECECDNMLPALVGGWSDCIIQSLNAEDMRFASMSLTSLSARHKRTNETGVTGLGPQVYCGVGKRYMAYSCQNAEHADSSETLMCTGQEYQEENCTIPCPVDCQTTQWSTWSICSSTCGSGVQLRERRIMTMPENGGRKCPSVYGLDKETQTKVCTGECNYHIWKVENWGQCIPSGARACGEGTHSRTVRCVSVGSEGFEMTVDESYCNSDDEPQTVKPCSLPCPGECVMSEWSDWTLCRQPCSGKQTQSRIHHVLRMPATYAVSGTCYTQREERPCERWKYCIEYLWELSDWTSCLVNGGGNECGVGHKERYALCRKENGEIMESYKCEKLFGPVSEPLVVSCEIPCDNDCLLSDWSDWNTCSATCGIGFTRRRRSILQNPMGNGRQCPEKMEQVKPCVNQGCYRWSVSEWSHCIIPKGVCGNGVQERNISCLNDEGRSVSFSRCPIDLEIFILQTSHPCYVPCPGECKMSEWSSWSHCFISCEDFDQGYTVGVQARSQSVLAYPAPGNPPCHDTPWEERVCDAKNCSFFTWVTSDWDMTTLTRQVYCVQNDRATVMGGCDENNVPAHVLNCTDPICLNPARCVDINVCSCSSDDGLELQFVSPTTVTCIMNATSAVDNAATVAEIAKSPNIWMYAVIAVGTLLVIALTAALHHMCELFRTGPRPRRKEEYSPEPSIAEIFNGVQVLPVNGQASLALENLRSDNLYKQIGNHDQVGRYVFEETVIPSILSPSSCHKIISHVSYNPDVDAVTSTPELSSLTTVTTPLTPINAVNIPNRSVGDVGSDHSCHVLRHKHNRRYNRIHRLLPAGFVKCFVCSDRSSGCILNEQNATPEINKIAGYQGQMLSFAGVDNIENTIMFEKECYTNTSPDFRNHSCMLPRSLDIRPHNLDLPMHENVFDNINLTETFIKRSTLQPDQTVTSPRSPNVFTASSKVSDSSQAVLSPSWRTSSSESLALSSEQMSGRHEESSQCSLQLGDTAETLIHHTNSSERGLSFMQQHSSNRPTHLAHTIKSTTTPTQLQSDEIQKQIQLENILPFCSSNPLPTVSLYNTVQPDLTNTHITHGSARQIASDVGFSDANKLSFSPLHIRVSPISSNRADDLTCDRFGRNNPTIHQTGQSETSSITSNPHSVLSDSLYCIHTGRHPSSSYRRHTKQPMIHADKAHISPISRGWDEDNGGNDVSPSTFRTFSSLPGNLTNNVNVFETIFPVLEKISQDSGHSTIYRSQTVSPEGGSIDNPNITGNDRCIGLSPLHVQTSLELKRGSPLPSLCNSCIRQLDDVGIGMYLTETPDSTVQQDCIVKSMETSL